MAGINTKLDANQVLKQAYDEPNQRLRVDATVTASIGEVTIIGPSGDELEVNPDGSINTNITGALQIEVSAADGDNIAISDGTNTAGVTADGSLKVVTSNTLITAPFDYVGATYPSATVENYLYRNGGPAGTIVGLVTVTYTDATKEFISSVAKS